MKAVIKYLLIVLLSVGLSVGICILIYQNKLSTQKEEYEQVISGLQTTLDEIGPIISVYSLKEELHAGKRLEQVDLATMRLPQKMISDEYFDSPEEIIGKQLKIDTKVSIPITRGMLMGDEQKDDTREFDIYVDSYPIDLKPGNYVDLNLELPNGASFLVLSHMRVESIHGKLLKVRMDMKERQLYEASLVDMFIHRPMGAGLEAARYVDPGVQKKAQVTYAVTPAIKAVIAANPNIVTKINDSINDPTRTNIDTMLTAINPNYHNQVGTGRADYYSKIITENALLLQKRQEAEREAELMEEEAAAPPTTREIIEQHQREQEAKEAAEEAGLEEGKDLKEGSEGVIQ